MAGPSDLMLGAGGDRRGSTPGLLDMAAGTGPLGLDPMFAGPGGSYNEPAYLAQVAANAARSNVNTAARDREFPAQAQFGSWAPYDFAGRAGASGQQFAHSPDMDQYFDASGQPRVDDPRKVAADAGINTQQLAAGLMPRHGTKYGSVWQGYDFPSDKGGFFRISDLYKNYPSGVPRAASAGQGGLSTNNWRLLGQGPGWIMRNGQLIDTQGGGTRWGGPAGWSPSGGNSGEQSMLATQTALGAGAGYGVPNMLQAGLGMPVTYGWPGAASGWLNAGMTSEG